MKLLAHAFLWASLLSHVVAKPIAPTRGTATAIAPAPSDKSLPSKLPAKNVALHAKSTTNTKSTTDSQSTSTDDKPTTNSQSTTEAQSTTDGQSTTDKQTSLTDKHAKTTTRSKHPTTPSPSKTRSTSGTGTGSATYGSWRFAHTGEWINKPCTGDETDARKGTWWDKWTQAEVPDAWKQLLQDFKDDRNNKDLNPLSLDAWLWNAFWADDPYCRVHDSGSCKVPTCDPKRLPSAAEKIMKSFTQLNQLITTAWDSFVETTIINTGEIQNFVETFAQRDPHLDEKATKEIIDSVTLAVGLGSASLWNDVFKEAKIFPQYLKDKPGVKAPKPNPKGKDPEGAKPPATQEGNERSVYKDMSNAAIALGFTGGKDSLSSAKDPMQQTTAELQHYASVFFNETSKTMVNQLFDMMWANDSKTQDKVSSMMLDGGMWNMSNVFANDPTSLQSNQNRIFWGKMLPEVWKLSDEPMNAFIMRADHTDWLCGDKTKEHGGHSLSANPLPKWKMGQYMEPETNEATYWCDNNDTSKANTFWLLNGNYKSCKGGTCAEGWYPFKALKGGDKKTLDGSKWPMVFEDIITSAYGGFLQNGKRNGYKMPDDSSLVVTQDWNIEDYGWSFLGNDRTPGFYNIPICLDPQEARENIRKGIKPPCGAVPNGDQDVSGSPNDAGYIGGWCTVHITQWQPNLKGNKASLADQVNNPLNEYQISAAIYQNDNSPLVFATKQPIDGTIGVKSKLPHTLYVQDNYKDEKGNDMLAFWYNDQFWLQNNTDHHCSNPDVWDGGKREFSTGFSCADPDADPKKDPPVPVPGNAVEAYYGTTDPKTVSDVKTYAKGDCEIHIREYQQNEMKNALNAGTYALEITIWDDKHNLIAYTPKANKPPGMSNTVNTQGPLPYLVMCWSGTEDGKGDNDKALPACKYAADKFVVGKDRSQNPSWDFKGGVRDLWEIFKC